MNCYKIVSTPVEPPIFTLRTMPTCGHNQRFLQLQARTTYQDIYFFFEYSPGMYCNELDLNYNYPTNNLISKFFLKVTKYFIWTTYAFNG